MPTTVTKTIGSGGDYTTLQAWFDAAPASLVSADQIWRGTILSPSDTFAGSGTALLSMTGKTVDSTRYFELTTAAGASWRDDSSVQTHALRYGANTGCTISNSTTEAVCIGINQDYTRVSNLQIGALGVALAVGVGAGATNCDISNCILEGDSASSGALQMYGAGNKIRNCLIVQRHSGAAEIAFIGGGSAAYNCTFAVPSDKTAATAGIRGSYAAATVQNCGIFGASTLTTGSAPTLTTCASDVTAGTGHIQVSFGTSTFVNVADATRDFRLVTGSGLIGAGTTDATNAATDIAGTARPQGTGYDIGAWEFVSGGGGSALPVLVTYYRRMRD